MLKLNEIGALDRGLHVEAMHLMLNSDVAVEDYVVATGELHSVKEFLDLSPNYLQFDYEMGR